VLTPETYWPAATTLSVLAMGLVLLGTTQFTALGISLEKKSNLLSIAAWIAAIVNFLLNLVLIPIWGALGSGAATFAAYAILTGLYLYWAQKLHYLPLETKKLLFSLLIVVSTPFLSALLYSFTWDVWITGIKVLILGLVLLLGFAVRIVKLSDIKRLSLRGIP
jgi:O-antigen/teichoic acid export membrane protein